MRINPRATRQTLAGSKKAIFVLQMNHWFIRNCSTPRRVTSPCRSQVAADPVTVARRLQANFYLIGRGLYSLLPQKFVNS